MRKSIYKLKENLHLWVLIVIFHFSSVAAMTCFFQWSDLFTAFVLGTVFLSCGCCEPNTANADFVHSIRSPSPKKQKNKTWLSSFFLSFLRYLDHWPSRRSILCSRKKNSLVRTGLGIYSKWTKHLWITPPSLLPTNANTPRAECAKTLC